MGKNAFTFARTFIESADTPQEAIYLGAGALNNWLIKTETTASEIKDLRTELFPATVNGSTTWYRVINCMFCTDREFTDPIMQTRKELMTLEQEERQAAERRAATVTTNNSRAHGMKSVGILDALEWSALCIHFGDICLACQASRPLAIDHVIPLVLGGMNHITNVQPLCRSCNSSKGARIKDYRDPHILASFLSRLYRNT